MLTREQKRRNLKYHGKHTELLEARGKKGHWKAANRMTMKMTREYTKAQKEYLEGKEMEEYDDVADEFIERELVESGATKIFAT